MKPILSQGRDNPARGDAIPAARPTRTVPQITDGRGLQKTAWPDACIPQIMVSLSLSSALCGPRSLSRNTRIPSSISIFIPTHCTKRPRERTIGRGGLTTAYHPAPQALRFYSSLGCKIGVRRGARALLN